MIRDSFLIGPTSPNTFVFFNLGQVIIYLSCKMFTEGTFSFSNLRSKYFCFELNQSIFGFVSKINRRKLMLIGCTSNYTLSIID